MFKPEAPASGLNLGLHEGPTFCLIL